MINFWKSAPAKFEKIDTITRHCWVDVTDPTQTEIGFLANRLKIPIDLIQDVLDIDERSRAELDEGWFFLIIRVPIHQENNRIPYITVPLGIFISRNAIVTICAYQNEIIPNLIQLAKSSKISTLEPSGFILQGFLISAKWFLRFLKQINIHINMIERELEKSTRNKELQYMLRMEKCLVYFISSLRANALVLERVRNSKLAQSQDFDEDLLEDAIIENRQAIEMANIYSDIQSGMMDAFASVIGNNQNMIMKQLTLVSIILMIPTLIASLYGMNVPNGIETNPYAFIGIISVSMILSIIGVLFFKRFKWF